MEKGKIKTGNFFSLCWIYPISVVAFNSLSLIAKNFTWTQLIIDLFFLAMAKYCYDHGVKIEKDILGKMISNEVTASGAEEEFLRQVNNYYRALILGYCVYYVVDGIARLIIHAPTTDRTSVIIGIVMAYNYRKDYPSAKKKAAEKSVP